MSNKEILISIRPEWVAKILSGEKTVEVRKTRPKVRTPFKCFIYCTLGKELWGDGTAETWWGIAPDEDIDKVFRLNPSLSQLNGKVIGEFICKNVYWQHLRELYIFEDFEKQMRGSCLTRSELASYLKCSKGTNLLENHKKWEFYTWHISDLKIYDTPKELSEFGLKRPPQSWCYVKQLGDYDNEL